MIRMATRGTAVFHVARVAVVEATTKSGKTVGCMAWLIEQTVLGRSGDHFWWLAPVSSQARMVESPHAARSAAWHVHRE